MIHNLKQWPLEAMLTTPAFFDQTLKTPESVPADACD